MAKFYGKRVDGLTPINIEFPKSIHAGLKRLADENGIAQTSIINALLNALVAGDIEIRELPRIPRARGVFVLSDTQTLDDTLGIKFTLKNSNMVINPSNIIE